MVSQDGKIMFISANASTQLGISQVELTGNSLFDYVAPEDQAELSAVLNNSIVEEPGMIARHRSLDEEIRMHGTPNEPHGFEVPRSFFIRMKCILAKRNAGLTYSGFKVRIMCPYFIFN